MLSSLTTILYLLVVPLVIVILEKRFSLVQKIGPMVILYIIGLIIGNIGILGEKPLALCTNISNFVVILSIPLMLMGCNFRNVSAKSVLKVFLSGLASVLIVIISGFFIFRNQAVAAGIELKNFAKTAAAMTSIYTGGIPNLAPVARAVNLPQNLFLIVSGYDLIVTGIYLIIIVFFGKKIVSAIFHKKITKNENKESNYDQFKNNSAIKIDNKKRILNIFLGIVVAAAIAGISVLISKIFPEEYSTIAIILCITTLSILISFWKPIKRLNYTFDTGLYFVYVFCLAVASMVNISELEFSKYAFILFYVAFAVLGSLILQILFAKLLKIDGNLAIAASISLINSPPFVPMAAAALDDKDIVLPGIAIGLLGYAAGNYLGIGMFMLLTL